MTEAHSEKQIEQKRSHPSAIQLSQKKRKKGRDEPTSKSNDDHGDDDRFFLPRATSPVSPRGRRVGLPRLRGSASSRVGVPVLNLPSFRDLIGRMLC